MPFYFQVVKPKPKISVTSKDAITKWFGTPNTKTKPVDMSTSITTPPSPKLQITITEETLDPPIEPSFSISIETTKDINKHESLPPGELTLREIKAIVTERELPSIAAPVIIDYPSKPTLPTMTKTLPEVKYDELHMLDDLSFAMDYIETSIGKPKSCDWFSKSPIMHLWSKDVETIIPLIFSSIPNCLVATIRHCWAAYVTLHVLKPKPRIITYEGMLVEFNEWYVWLLQNKLMPSIIALLDWLSKREVDKRSVYLLSSKQQLINAIGYRGSVVTSDGLVLTSSDIKSGTFKGYFCTDCSDPQMYEGIFPPKEIDELITTSSLFYVSK